MSEHTRRDGGVDSRPMQAFVHGLSGPVAIISGRTAAKLFRLAPQLAAYPAAHRGEDVEFDAQLLALRAVAKASTADGGSASCSDSGSEVARPARAAEGFASLGTGEAATLLGVSDRAVRLAIKRRRLRAVRIGSSWRLDRDDVATFAARRNTR